MEIHLFLQINLPMHPFYMAIKVHLSMSNCVSAYIRAYPDSKLFILHLQVAYPKTNEVYIFNRHGHHVETRDLITGRTLYAFLYSKNTSFGRLSQVTDSSMNKILFLRDYKSSVSQVENTAGEKFKVSGRIYNYKFYKRVFTFF